MVQEETGSITIPVGVISYSYKKAILLIFFTFYNTVYLILPRVGLKPTLSRKRILLYWRICLNLLQKLFILNYLP
jgi:hypothetical protein